ncbi:putative hydroxypyruvate isomerase [Schistocerca cancellata]|uniref:putative hydroxypyruvate isomerase n=1 Tax=Schistocerca cancellata TaxID=274614 RepID=UPI00211999F3|nr:putative hydroxypyruvate isomerase [Schistocerca cancellata]
MTLRVCANLSFMFQETTSLIERYALAKEAGFRAVECAFPYEYPLEEVISAKESAGVDQILINVFPGDQSKGELGFAAIPGQEEKFKESLSLAVKYAKGLHCKRIHVMSGNAENPSSVNDDIYEKNIKYAASLFEKEGIVGLIEPINPHSVPNYYMNNFSKGLDIVRRINSPNLRLMMDLFHVQHLQGDLTHTIKMALPYVGHIQIAQVPNRNEPDTPGEVNYSYIFDVLKDNGYDGWIGLEYKPAKGTREGLKWIQNYRVTQ